MEEEDEVGLQQVNLLLGLPDKSPSARKNMETETRREEALVGTKAREGPSCLFINAYLLVCYE